MHCMVSCPRDPAPVCDRRHRPCMNTQPEALEQAVLQNYRILCTPGHLRRLQARACRSRTRRPRRDRCHPPPAGPSPCGRPASRALRSERSGPQSHARPSVPRSPFMLPHPYARATTAHAKLGCGAWGAPVSKQGEASHSVPSMTSSPSSRLVSGFTMQRSFWVITSATVSIYSGTVAHVETFAAGWTYIEHGPEHGLEHATAIMRPWGCRGRHSHCTASRWPERRTNNLSRDGSRVLDILGCPHRNTQCVHCATVELSLQSRSVHAES